MIKLIPILNQSAIFVGSAARQGTPAHAEPPPKPSQYHLWFRIGKIRFELKIHL